VQYLLLVKFLSCRCVPEFGKGTCVVQLTLGPDTAAKWNWWYNEGKKYSGPKDMKEKNGKLRRC